MVKITHYVNEMSSVFEMNLRGVSNLFATLTYENCLKCYMFCIFILLIDLTFAVYGIYGVIVTLWNFGMDLSFYCQCMVSIV